MRRLVLGGPHRLSVEDSDEPRPGPGEVLIRPLAVGVCGSDVHGYAGRNDRRAPGVVMGHEAVGVVSRLGPDVAGLAAGDRVAVNPVVACGECRACLEGRANVCARRKLYGCVLDLDGAFAEAMVVRAANLVRLSAGAALEPLALAEPMAVGTHAAAGLSSGSVLVVGGGPIGIGAALGARRTGAPQVVLSEPDPHRREVAGALGLDTVEPDAVREGAFDWVLECVGASATVAAGLRAARPGGQVVVVGIADRELAVPAGHLVMEERGVRGSAVYLPEEFERTVRWIESGEVDLGPLIERRVELDELPDVFAAYAAGGESAVKTLMVAA